MVRALHAAHSDHRNRDARGDGGDLGERDGADRGAGQAAGAASEPGRATPASPVRTPHARGASAIARSVLISDTASAPPCSAASAHAATSAVLGVSLTISGLRVRARTARTHLLELARVGADVEAGLDVGAGHVELDRGDLGARVARLQQRGDLLGARAHDVRDQRHGRRVWIGARADPELGQLRQVLGEVAVEALVGQPDRVDRGRRAPPTGAAAGCRRAAASVIVFET